jgi:parallel beta-helix repeat protein
VIISNLEGVTLEESFNNVISDNYIADNDGHGIIMYNSANNTISKNEVTGNARDGVNVENYLTNIKYSLPNTVTENQIMKNNGSGVFFRDIQDSEVTKNNITLNRGIGVGFGYGPNGTIQGNYVAKNGIGIWMSNAVSNKVTLNTVRDNDGWGISLEGSQHDNIIHHNNFINNSSTEELQAYIEGTWIYPGLYAPQRSGEEREPPQLVDGAANVWDDGEEGNFWSDYMQRYPSALEVGNTGAGDTPYVINKNNLDSHPLIAPIEISTSSPPLSSLSPYQEPTSTSSPEPKSEPDSFPAEMAISSVVVFAVSGGILIYLKKRKR